MDIELSRLSAVETPVHGDLRLTDPDGSLAEEGIRFPEPFRFEGGVRLQRTAGHGEVVVVRGTATGVIGLECGRCLTSLRQPVTLEFEARYADAAHAPRPEPPSSRPVRAEDDWEGVQLQREDLDVAFLPSGATSLRMEDTVREQVLLEVPIRPLCDVACRGLCPACGQDLNELGGAPCPCGRAQAPGDLRLQALTDIKKKLDGSGRQG